MAIIVKIIIMIMIMIAIMAIIAIVATCSYPQAPTAEAESLNPKKLRLAH